MGTKQLIVVLSLLCAGTTTAAGLGNLLNDLSRKPPTVPTQPQAPKPPAPPIKK